MRHKHKDISYEINCTALRMAETTEYLLLEPQPARENSQNTYGGNSGQQENTYIKNQVS